jgi:KipI family sensor histidine kinase inhibitor
MVAMRVRPVGDAALLIEVDDPAAWFAELWRRRGAGELAAVDIVPGARTVLLDGLADPAATAEAVRAFELPPADPSSVLTDAAGLVRIDVSYDGADLAAVAALWGTDVRGVVDRLGGIELRVAFCGFTPGWAYLTGLPAELAVPRLEAPRARVPAGSVALADVYAGIYPTASPGGWRIVGRTDAPLFDPDRDPPALLTPGARVRLVERATT